MLRVKISNFIKKYKDKIRDLANKLVIVAVVVLAATIVLSSLSNIGSSGENSKNVYKPTQTIISGSSIPEKEYEEDSNLVNTFLDFCNDKKVEEAYNLLSEKCKKEQYSNIQVFQDNYYNHIFDKKRNYNLQAWISTSDYIVYKVRYTNDILSTGTYDETDVYQDYLTLNRKNETEKISIGNFVDSEECSVITKTNEVEATVTKKIICLNYEEYEINITNKTDKTILLSRLKSSKSIQLISNSGTEYSAYTSKLFLSNLMINPNEEKKVTIRFNKELGIGSESKFIVFSNVIKDYDAYIENEREYEDIISITIKV